MVPIYYDFVISVNILHVQWLTLGSENASSSTLDVRSIVSKTLLCLGEGKGGSNEMKFLILNDLIPVLNEILIAIHAFQLTN